jgi:hypothetical protein
MLSGIVPSGDVSPKNKLKHVVQLLNNVLKNELCLPNVIKPATAKPNTKETKITPK